ncbi:AsmA family protein [Salmonella enterica subsp. enterica]|uniref:AsmA family protein n=1 Tax=Salmonella enterica I TaxID=59201 RepID=A0A379WIN1_SALET|nr:AsmA family protein [Salmonella enterica subsp. enterica]
MKLIGRLLLYVLIACLVVIFGFYFLLQTRWGADHVSNWGIREQRLSPHIRRDGSSFFPPHPIFYWRM